MRLKPYQYLSAESTKTVFWGSERRASWARWYLDGVAEANEPAIAENWTHRKIVLVLMEIIVWTWRKDVGLLLVGYRKKREVQDASSEVGHLYGAQPSLTDLGSMRSSQQVHVICIFTLGTRTSTSPHDVRIECKQPSAAWIKYHRLGISICCTIMVSDRRPLLSPTEYIVNHSPIYYIKTKNKNIPNASSYYRPSPPQLRNDPESQE